ncbi:beta strand repeat-containing protein [Phytopseudomonas daroniae]|uniref:beta strand repeat-containing protein n=1 Tax=Pseudomonadaceae TaxID=135621 RepID=UPI001F6079B1|nr:MULTISPECIES: filamentous hemagglutinin N-terminal domain-containing protein [Pseudomonas]
MNSSQSRRGRRPQLPSLKPLSYAVLCVMHGLMPIQAMALGNDVLPSNGQISAGSGSISQSGNVLDVTQNSQKLIATWDTFNIGRDAKVNFHQPGTSAVALNRVMSSDASQILGQLNANGQVYLINPSGVLFGSSAAVNVGGLVASTLEIADDDFMAGRMRFHGGSSAGAVINQGTLRAADGGSVALLGSQVRNEGSVVAKMGSVVLGGGEKITLDYHGDGLINLQVDEAVIDASVVNQGLLQANGGTVIMSARASNAMLNQVVNNEGVIEATSLQQRGGRIVLDGGDSGVVASSGVLDVSGRNAGERGGEVTMTGEYVGLFDDARIDASGDAGGGTVLLGGDYQGSGPLHQASATHMGQNARIEADALNSGDGGKVILWATDSTQFHGNISVIGGGESGKGGLVETSGHVLDATGRVNLSAASGQGGTWLLDPYNINITSGANNGTSSSSPFTPDAGRSSNLSSATLNASLSEGANIIVQTSSGPGTSGDINVLDNVQAQGNASLTLTAHRNINMNGTSISHADGKSLNVSMQANFNNSGNGSVALNNATIRTNGGNLTIGGAVDPSSSYASTNVSNGTGVSIRGGSLIDTRGGDVTIRGATSATLAAGASASANAVNISASTIDAGGGNISITARQDSATGSGDAFILHGGSSLLTEGAGAIDISADNLGSGNGTRIFSTSNTIAAIGSGNVTLTGKAASGFGVLICSTASGSTQNIGVGGGTLTINGASDSGRGLYLAASGNGAVNLGASDGGNIVLAGDSGGSYGTVLNVTGAGASINLLSDGDISVEGNTSGGTTPALGLITSGSGSAIDIASTTGNVRLAADNNVINTGSGSFRALYLDASGDNSAIRVGSQSGNLTLEGNSVSGRGVDLAASGTGATIDLATTSGNILISGDSTGNFGDSAILLNATSGSQGISVATRGGDITLNGTTSTNASADAVNIARSTLNADGGNISITARQNNTDGIGDAFVLTRGSNLLTKDTGSIDISADNLGSGNGTRVFSTTNTIAASGSGNVTLTGNAASGFGVLICSTASGSTQNIGVGSGTLTINGISDSGRGLYLAAAGNGAINLTGGSGNILLTGDSGGSYGTILNVTGSTASINLLSDGDISVTGNSSGGSTPALGLIASGSGSAGTPGAQINIASTAGDVRLTANNSVINTGSGSFRALYLDASGDNSAIRVGSQSGNLTLEGNSVSGRGVDLAPSGEGAAIELSTTSGDVLINGNSTASFGGYGILLNSTGSSQGVSITTQSGDITLRGDSVGTSDAIALGGSGTASTNRIASQGGNILLDGHFHSPDTSELDHGIALLGVTNVIQTTGNGNVTLVGRSTGAGDGIDFYGSGNNLISVENGHLSLTGHAADANGISMLTGQTELRATGSGSITLDGYSKTANGIHFYPSNSASSVTIATNSGNLSLNGRSDGGTDASGVFVRSGPNGVTLQSSSGDILLSGRGDNGASGITFNGSSNGTNSLVTGGNGNLTLAAYSHGGMALNFVSGNNLLRVQDGTLLIDADAPGGTYIAHGSDNTSIGASGSGAVVYRLGGLVNSSILGSASEAPRAYLQQQITGNAWSQVLYPDYRQTPLAPQIDRVALDLSQWQAAGEN